MPRIVVAYATRHGQAKKVAEHVAASLRQCQPLEVQVLDVRALARDAALADVAGVVLAASVHIGAHEREMVSFVKRARTRLDSIPTAFLSLSLSQAGVEDHALPQEKRAASARDVQMMLERFFAATGFRPRQSMPVAGALMYTRYNPFVRFIMRRIARAAGATTDTSRDHEFTNWEALTVFSRGFADQLAQEPALHERAAPASLAG